LVIPNQAVATYVTNWTYDSWNRVRTMTYPDSETLTYTYNLGGLLSTLTGKKRSDNYTYVKSITYDKFEQRASITYGSNVVTNYTYNDSSRNLSNLKVFYTTNTYMNNTYAYDAVDNVRCVTNSASPQSTGIGGGITHTYAYDGLNRLTSATGTYTGSGTGTSQKTATYGLSMSYDNLHNITSKKQDLAQNNIQFIGTLNAGYTLKYAYNQQNSQQVTEIADTSYRTTGTPVGTPGRQDFVYDANGNLVNIHTTRMEANGRENLVNTRRLLWDEENRLLGVSDNGAVSNYWYDASGERVFKQTSDGEGVLVNGRPSGSRTGTSVYTIYVNPYTVISNGMQMSKHFYIGSQRIASQLCSSRSTGSANNNPLTNVKATGTGVVDYTSKYADLTAKVKTRFDSLNVPYKGTNNNGVGFWSYVAASDERYDQYYFHPDHLGSSSIITNYAKQMVQHLEYVPFGEVFLDERTTTYDTPYKFNAKELDEETGLYFYGARYLDPRLSLWLSVDPLAEKYPNVSSYVYCENNPVKFVDPDGRDYFQHQGGNGKSAVFWQNGNAKTVEYNGQTYSNIGETYTQNIGEGMSVTYTQNKATSITTNTMSTDQWVSQYSKSDWNGTPADKACNKACDAMLSKNGDTSNGMIQIVNNAGGGRAGTANGASTKAINNMSKAIDLGSATKVNVDFRNGSQSADNMGDHFVVVQGKKENIINGKVTSTSFLFFDPGTKYQSKGTSPSNQFKVVNGRLEGDHINNGKMMVGTSIR